MERLHIRNPNFSFYCLFYPLISHIVSAHCFFQTNFSICKIEEASSVIRFFKFLKLFYCCSITVVCIFSPPLYPTPAKPTSLPCFHPSPWFYPCVLYSSSWKPLSPLSPPYSPVATVTMFLISMTLVKIFSLFKKLLYCWSFTVVCIFSPPLYPTPAKPSSLPCSHLPPKFCPCVLYSSSWKPFSPLSPHHSPLAIVRLFCTC